MENIANFVGDSIKGFRKRNNLTQSDLGKKIGVSLTTISGYERGESSPDNIKMYALAKALNVSINDFFPPTKSNKNVPINKSKVYTKKMLPEDEMKKKFGKNLEHLREKRKIMQKDLAIELDLKPNSISNYENGKSFPTVPVLLKISDYFNVSTEELLYSLKETVNQKEKFLKDILDNVSEDELLEKYDFSNLFNELPFEQKKKVIHSIEVEYFKLSRSR